MYLSLFDISFDFSELDLIPSAFRAENDAARVLNTVASWFQDIFEFFILNLIQPSGYYWLIAAGIFIAAMGRLVVSPIVGLRRVDLGSDRVRRKKSDD